MAGYNLELPNAYGAYASAQTDTALVAAATGAQIRVAAVYVMTDTAGTVTFESGGSTELFELYPGDNGGASVVAPVGQFLFKTVAGESLTVTTDIAGNHAVNVLYEVR